MTNGADAKVNAWILADYRKTTATNATQGHLIFCPAIEVMESELADGTYGCDTGCEYATLSATITCPHELSDEYEYGRFGEIADILSDIG